MTAVINRVGSTVDAIDLFCGFGGSSQGIHAAGAEVKVAANHNAHAIKVHSANFPNVEHRIADLVNPDAGDYVDPATLPAARYLWASPACTHHSRANADKLYKKGRGLFDQDEDYDEARYLNSERSRVTACCPLRYAAHKRPELVVIENVVEFAMWGPGRDGSTFRWWLREWEGLGYEWDALFLNSMFFPPCPQSRDRMYVVFWRKGNRRPDLDYRPLAYCTSDRCGGEYVNAVQSWKPRKKSWPLPRWGRYGVGGQYLYRCPACNGVVEPAAWPAYTAIDWSDLGPLISERHLRGLDPLAPNTIARIQRGLRKFSSGPGVILPTKALWGSESPMTWPVPTQTGQQDKAMATIGEPLFTQTANQVGQGLALRGIVLPAAGGMHHGLTIPPALHAKFNGGPADTAWHNVMKDPFNTVTCGGR